MEKETSSIRDSQIILEIQERFARLNASESIHLISSFEKEKSVFKKMISLTRSFLTAALSFLDKHDCFTLSKSHQIKLSYLKNGLLNGKENSFFLDQIPVIAESNAPSQREEDAFRMKAITLIQNQAPLFPSIKKALASLKESPIYTTISPCLKFNNSQVSSVITLEQKLTPFPGETIVLKGAFIRSSNSLTPTIPILESFELSRKSEQSGFPYPSQYTGWGLSEVLIPLQIPQNEALTTLSTLLQKKHTICSELSLQGPLSIKAKRLLWQKETCVNDHAEEFLSLHKKLSVAILKAASMDDNVRTINQFFDELKDQPTMYSTLSNTYSIMNESFVALPFKNLLKHSKMSFFEARQILENTQKESMEKLLNNRKHPPAILEFIATMGKIIGTASDRIILQHLSSLMEFPPPFLINFEKKLQTVAYRQLEFFAAELEKESEDISFNEIRESLLSDIHLFEQPFPSSSFIDMLESYYDRLSTT